MEPLKQIKWHNDAGLEFLLKDGKLDWKLEDLRLNDINIEESKKRQSRLDRTYDPERALTIAVAMEQGLPFPSICVTKVKGYGYVILAGMHRVCAVKEYVAGRDNSYTIRAYVVKAGDAKYINDVLPTLTNAIEGVGLTLEQRRHRAAELVVTDGFPVVDVARRFGLAVSTLEKHVGNMQLIDRLVGLGIDIKKSLTKSSIVENLKTIAHNDNLLSATASVLAENMII